MISKEDLDNYGKLGNLIVKADFNLQGGAVIPSALLLKWYNELGSKLKAVMAKQEADREMADMEASIKPIEDKKEG